MVGSIAQEPGSPLDQAGHLSERVSNPHPGLLMWLLPPNSDHPRPSRASATSPPALPQKVQPPLRKPLSLPDPSQALSLLLDEPGRVWFMGRVGLVPPPSGRSKFKFDICFLHTSDHCPATLFPRQASEHPKTEAFFPFAVSNLWECKPSHQLRHPSRTPPPGLSFHSALLGVLHIGSA